MRNQEWNSSLAQLHPLHLAQLVFGLFVRNAVHSEASLGVIHQPEVLSRLLDADHIHEARGVCRVRADFAIDFDQALHHDCFHFSAIEGVLEAASY